MPKRRKKLSKCLFCCMGNRVLSDGDQDFVNIGAAPLPERVFEATTEQEANGNPQISTGTMSEANGAEASEGAEPNLAVVGKRLTIGNRSIKGIVGDAVPSGDEDDSPHKSVRFAMCHDDLSGKDTRDQYRSTPVKEKRCRAVYPVEQFFFQAKGSNDYVKIPMPDLKRYVTEYVRKIVQCSMAAVAEEDFGQSSIDDVIKASNVMKKETSDTESLSTDDGIAFDDSDELEIVSVMVDNMLSDIAKSLSEEQTPQELSVSEEEVQMHFEMSHACEESMSEVSFTSDAVTQIESASSLEWDGYEPLLKEDPAYTDISIKCPEISVGTSENLMQSMDLSTSNAQ